MIRWFVVASALAFASPVLTADGEREFGQTMLERLRSAKSDTELRIDRDDPLAIQIKVDGEWGNGVINTHRLYGFCQTASSEECHAAIEEFADSISIPPSEPAPADLRVIVRGTSYLDYLLRSGPDAEHQPLYRPIGEDLFAIVAFDGPRTIALAMRPQLRDLGITDDAAWQLATAQTRAVLPPLPSGAGLADQPVAFEEFEYLASLLADTEAWRGVAAEAGPDLFVTAVSDYFVFTGVLPDGSDLERFKQTVREDCAAQQRCISPNVYRFREGRWVIAN
jgi:hypothetical protein